MHCPYYLRYTVELPPSLLPDECILDSYDIFSCIYKTNKLTKTWHQTENNKYLHVQLSKGYTSKMVSFLTVRNCVVARKKDIRNGNNLQITCLLEI